MIFDELQKASCSAYIPIRPHGWIYAIHRDCASKATCANVCNSKYLHVQDTQTVLRTWRCIGGIHIYFWKTSNWKRQITHTKTENSLLWL